MSPVTVGTSRSTYALQTGRAKLWILLVGVNQYWDEHLPNLRYSAGDCQGLAEALAAATQGFPEKEVIIHHDFAAQAPKLESFRASLQQIVSEAKQQDTILFYFSGHGVLEPSNQQAVLCLADTHKDQLLSTGLRLQELLQVLSDCAAHQQLVWLDACHSGNLTLRGSRGEVEEPSLLNPTSQLVEVLRQRAAQSQGFYALLSCDQAQQSWEFPELGHGVFTYYLMRGLQGEAADLQGVIEADGLYKYVYYQTLQYIDKTNQQLRLINQQKRSRGEMQLHPEYPLQTPKRIVEGTGELILGMKPTDTDSWLPRQALVVAGLSGSQTTLALSKVLQGAGSFELEYWPKPGQAWSEVRDAIQTCLRSHSISRGQSGLSNPLGEINLTAAGETAMVSDRPISEGRAISSISPISYGLSSGTLREQPGFANGKATLPYGNPFEERERLRGSADDSTEPFGLSSGRKLVEVSPEARTATPTAIALLYLQGRIEETEEGEAWLVFGDDVRLSRSWLRQELRHSGVAQQIVILDCPGASSLADWVEDLQLGPEQGQCIIAAAATLEEPERFAQTLLETLAEADQQVGLPVAGWIAQLQLYLAGTGITPHVWLSGAQGVIEVLPGIGARGITSTTALDLGLCPYMGLRAFGEADAQYFYGRETLTQKLMNQLSHRAFLAVVGASGSGKSSVVHAGLIAQLRQGKQLPGSNRWWIRSFRPGAHPLEALAQRLVDVGTEKERAYQQLQLEGMLYQGVEGFVHWLRTRPEPVVVLVVDQFEELFTLAAAEDRQRFLDIVLGALEYAADRFKLAIALRSDFIASGLDIPILAKHLQQSSVLVPSCLTADDYRQAIVRPAEEVGLQVESELVEVLLQELSHSAGDLPLLEFVLEQLWEHRHPGELTLQVYQQQIGGLKGALERKAQAVYDSLDPEAQACTQWIFLALTQLGEGTEDTRRRVLKSELMVKKYPAALVERTLQVLTAAKLVLVSLEADEVTVGQSRGSAPPPEELPLVESLKQEVTVEVTHEVLIRHWSTLRWWLEENRARLRSQRQIEQAAMLWKQRGQQSDFLLQGVRLAEAEEIYVQYTDELSQDVQLFIEACLESRQRQQRQAKKRLRQAQTAAIVIGALGLAALGFGGLAYLQRQAAQASEVEALNSLSKALLLSNQQLEALIASMKAGRQLQRTFGVDNGVKVKTASTLVQAIDNTQEYNRLQGHSGLVSDVRFSPDGQLIASTSWDGTIRLWQADGTLRQAFKGHEAEVMGVSFSPDGKTLASAGNDGTVKLWRLDGTLLKTFTGHQDGVTSVSFSPDGQILASASHDRTVKLWRLNGTLLKTFTGQQDGVTSVSFSPDGQTLASGSLDQTVRLWRVDGTSLKTFKGHSDYVTSVSFSPDGQTLASASYDRTVRLWNVASGTSQTLTRKARGLHSHKERVNRVSFSPDGRTLASSGADSTVELWSRDGTLLQTLNGHGAEVVGISFSPNGAALASASADKTVRLWSVNPDPKWHDGGVYSVSFSPDSKVFASAGFDTTVKLWHRLAGGSLLKTLAGHQMTVSTVNFSPDGRTLASGSADKTIKLWSVAEGTLLKTLTGHSDGVTSVSFSPDDKILASSSADRTVKLWNVAESTLLKTLTGHSDGVTSVSFSPNGSLASGSYDSTVKLWSSEGTLLKTFDQHGLAIANSEAAPIAAVSFSPDSKTLASASWDNTIRLWNVAEGRLLKTFTGHNDGVTSVSFSPDGKTLASGSADRTIKLWSVAEGTLLETFNEHRDQVHSVSFSPDGRTLLSASEDTTVVLRDLDLESLLKRGCDHLHDYLKTNPNVQESNRYLCDRSPH